MTHEIKHPGWRTDLPWADVVLDTQFALGPATRMPETLPAVAQDREALIGGWRITAHYLRYANRDAAGLLFARMEAVDGWVGVIAMEAESKSTVPWGQGRDVLPSVFRPLSPGQAGSELVAAHERSFLAVAGPLRTLLTAPAAWGLDETTTRQARLGATWAGHGAGHRRIADRLWDGRSGDDRLPPHLMLGLLDAGWIIDDEAVDWMIAAADHRWGSRHPRVWWKTAWSDLLRMRQNGWTPEQVTALHQSGPAQWYGPDWQRVAASTPAA